MADKIRLKHWATYTPKIKQNTHRNSISNDRDIREHASNIATRETGTKHKSRTGNGKPGTKEENHPQTRVKNTPADRDRVCGSRQFPVRGCSVSGAVFMLIRLYCKQTSRAMLQSALV